MAQGEMHVHWICSSKPKRQFCHLINSRTRAHRHRVFLRACRRIAFLCAGRCGSLYRQAHNEGHISFHRPGVRMSQGVPHQLLAPRRNIHWWRHFLVGSRVHSCLARLTIGSSDRWARLRWAKEGIDDWDKAASFFVGATARGSILSLGVRKCIGRNFLSSARSQSVSSRLR
jgi:hypothetical protein